MTTLFLLIFIHNKNQGMFIYSPIDALCTDKMMNVNNRDVETSGKEARPAFEDNALYSYPSSPNSKDSIQTGSISETLDSLVGMYHTTICTFSVMYIHKYNL